MVGLLLRLASQWIAGETIDEAIDRAKVVNGQGLDAILNILGEHAESTGEAEQSIKEYIQLIEEMDRSGVKGSVSVKLSQLGLDVDESLCNKGLMRIVAKAEEHGKFLWVDMEDSRYTQKTLDMYAMLLEKHPRVGVAIQAYLKRSVTDVRQIIEKKGWVRLVKGAYREPASTAYHSQQEIRDSFARLMEMFFEGGGRVAVATHDEELISKAVSLAERFKADFEFQMLMGVRLQRQLKLASRGFRLAQYVPFGRNWFPYSLRRLKERKRNIILMLRSLISG